jgi:hypothetical protein
MLAWGYCTGCQHVFCEAGSLRLDACQWELMSMCSTLNQELLREGWRLFQHLAIAAEPCAGDPVLPASTAYLALLCKVVGLPWF